MVSDADTDCLPKATSRLEVNINRPVGDVWLPVSIRRVHGTALLLLLIGVLVVFIGGFSKTFAVAVVGGVDMIICGLALIAAYIPTNSARRKAFPDEGMIARYYAVRTALYTPDSIFESCRDAIKWIRRK